MLKHHWFVISLVLVICGIFSFSASAQETTGGLQGTVKDPSGAIVPHAHVVVTGASLVGSKEIDTDVSGYYRFANLPPGTYTITATAKGFKTFKRADLNLEVGHLPTVDIPLEVGTAETIVEVSAAAPVIDTTTTQNITNVTKNVISNIPHGLSFQSVIQFAPMARNEPLAGASTNGMGSGGTGGSLPGSSGNGLGFGFSIGGAADSESSYLVEGQDTENNSGGYSKANVPFQFIQEVEVKTSGIEAEHGGALGGVINVVMKKGSNAYHGEFFATYEPSGVDANPTNTFLRYDPTQSGDASLGQDPGAQLYQAQKDHFRILQPGFSVGGPIVKDRLWFFAGFAPQINTRAKTVNFGSNDNNAGAQYFTQDKETYYGTARLDASVTQKIRLYGSWLYQYARETGNSLPISDPVKSQAGYLNTSTFSPLSAFSHGLGWAAPNSTYNVGADISMTPKVISTTRFGYFFENYHDFGWPTTAPDIVWNTNGAPHQDPVTGNTIFVCDNSATAATTGCPTGGNPLPTALAQPGGTSTTPYLGSFTLFNANKHYQFDQDVAFFKGGWWGTHNLKIGYQLNHLTNVIDQNGNVPQAFMNVGRGQSHNAFTSTGSANCTTLSADWTNGACAGLYGYLTVQDFSTILNKPASDYNHAFFAQDSWNVGHNLTLNLGIRVEKEYLPAPSGYNIKSINFGWSDKIEPRLGAAWDPTGHGKMKLFGSYSVVNDVMKLLLAQTSWGAQSFEQCIYALGPDGTPAGFSASAINLTYVNGRACPNGPANTQANFAGGTTPPSLVDAASSVSLVENINLRPWEPVAPEVKPYRQHEFVAGWDYQISRDWAFEARYDRRRLDHAIEDASLSDPAWGETYTIVNPGEGVNKTIDGYAAFLTSLGQAYGVPGWAFNVGSFGAPLFDTCPTCPANPKAIRNYDGAEFRLTKSQSKGWAGSFSYTWSRLWGNYTGLTTTDQIDGGSTGRNSPDTTRSFDEPFYYFGANGKSNDGPLPTDRPNTFKGYAYYQLSWGKGQTTTFGLFQSAYQGSPVSSYIDLASMPFGQLVAEATYIYGRGKWVNMTTDASGNITLGTPYDRRTSWFTQSDFNVGHQIKVAEGKAIAFEASAFNLLNQRAVTAYYGGMNSVNFQTPLVPGPGVSIFNGAATYQALESGYNPQTWINGNGGAVSPVIKSSWYGQPFLHQNARSIRFTLRYTF